MELNKIKNALTLAKECTDADVVTEDLKEILRIKIDDALQVIKELADLIEQEKKDEVIRFLGWHNEMYEYIPYTTNKLKLYNQFKEATK